MESVHELLGYPRIRIIQDTTHTRFSTDSLLLGSFATLNTKTKKIIDLCTGNAPIPLYLTMRTHQVIEAVEIQEKAFECALKSVKINHMEQQIKLHCADVKGIANTLGVGVYDLVTCNPPFFPYENGLRINANEAMSIARHEVLISLDEMVYEAKKLLNNGGRLAIVHRPERLVECLLTFKKHGIEPKRLRFVYPKPNSDANHILLEGIKSGQPGGLIIEPPLFIRKDKDTWSDEMYAIYHIGQE